MTLEDTRTHEELARMDREAENAAERMWRQTGREDVMSDRDRAERYKTLLEDARRERDEYRFRAETAEKAIAEQAKVIDRLRDENAILKRMGANLWDGEAATSEENVTLKARVETLETTLSQVGVVLTLHGITDTAAEVARVLNPRQETPHA